MNNTLTSKLPSVPPVGSMQLLGRVLVACEFSGIVRDAFAARGWDAWSCDILPTESKGQHFQGDVRDILHESWDIVIAHPPCTHLCSSGARYFAAKKADGRQKQGVDSIPGAALSSGLVLAGHAATGTLLCCRGVRTSRAG